MDVKSLIRKRLTDYIVHKYGTMGQMTKITGIPQSTVSSVLGKGGTGAPNSEFLYKLKMQDPDMDLNYIIGGNYHKKIDPHLIDEPFVPYLPSETKNIATDLLKSQNELITVIKDYIQEKRALRQ